MSSDWAASTLRWWQEAGVDALVSETPRNWLNPASPGPSQAEGDEAAPSPAVRVPPSPADPPPAELSAFQAWLLSSDTIPYATAAAPRLGPSGDPSSGLMVLVDMPAPEDFVAGTLLAGDAGALFDRMLAAIQLSREQLYLASLSPIRTATGMLDAAGAKALADLALHHVGLVRPRALLLFGDACAKAMFGKPVSATRGKWHEINSTAGSVNTLVTIRPAKLIAVPALKKLAWDDLQMLREVLKP